MDLLKPIKELMPAPLKRSIKRALGRPLTVLNSDWEILHPIGPVGGPHVVFDLGAHNGWFFQCWRSWCPGARVHAFEPLTEEYGRLEERYGRFEDVTLVNAAVGSAEGEQTFRVMEGSRVSSSLLDHDAREWDAIHYRTGSISTRAVPVTTLEAYCRKHAVGEIYLLKIDVQGYELEVLKGAEGILPRVGHIFVESGIRPLYAGAPTFADVHRHLSARGFHLMAMRAWHRGNNVLVESDMLFRRDDLAPPVDDGVGRVYVQAE